jgi:hypothetical protein
MLLNLNANGQTDHLHISDFDSKIVFFFELFPFLTGKTVSVHAKFNGNNVYLSSNYLFTISMLYTLVNF